MVNWLDYADTVDGRSHTVVGNLKLFPGFKSPQLGNERDLLVHLPPSYEGGSHHYPVLYLHDGQNLFDEHTSFAGEWQVDETMERLSSEGVEVIIVGIPNAGPTRLVEYNPFNGTGVNQGLGIDYLYFVSDTVKPFIDSSFRTLPGTTTTGILGSSMGGLISLYAFFRCPDVFGFAGVMSPALWYARGAIFDIVKDAPITNGRIYLDVGTREHHHNSNWLSAIDRSRRYYASVRRMHRLLVKKGYRPKSELLYVEEKWAHHSEEDWARRLPRAIRFFLSQEVVAA